MHEPGVVDDAAFESLLSSLASFSRLSIRLSRVAAPDFYYLNSISEERRRHPQQSGHEGTLPAPRSARNPTLEAPATILILDVSIDHPQ